MRIWHRLLLTLILAPILWRLLAIYLANQGGEPASDLWLASPALLGKVDLVTTIPALVLLSILMAVEWVLKAIGLDLLIAAIAPILAAAFAIGVTSLVHDPRIPEGLLGLFVVHGLVWGLSIREPLGSRHRANLAR